MTSKSKKPPALPKRPAIYQDQLPAVPGTEIALAARFPGETRTSGDAQVDYYATAIAYEWRRFPDAILKVGKICADALASLDHLQRQKLYEVLPFEKPAFSKLATIGRTEILFDENVQKHLPASWSIIYQLRDLTSEEIEAAISEKVLNPRTTRNDLNKWISEHSHRKKRNRGRQKPIDNTNHDDLLRRLTTAFTESSELMAVWNESPLAVRKQFARSLPKMA